MFWKKKQSEASEKVSAIAAAPPTQPKTKQNDLEDAAGRLAASLHSYSEAAYVANMSAPDQELKAAHRKVEMARKIVRDSRIGYALGRCLPDHMEHWHAWSQRPDFMKWVNFEASNITSTRSQEEDGARRIDVTTNHFNFKGRPYCLVFRNSGLSSAPGDDHYRGEVHFFAGDGCVAKFTVSKDLMKEFAQWQFTDVKALKVGTWMQDVLDMAAQIDANRQRRMDQFVDDHARKAADEIDLG
jgi:hypothetical protein